MLYDDGLFSTCPAQFLMSCFSQQDTYTRSRAHTHTHKSPILKRFFLCSSSTMSSWSSSSCVKNIVRGQMFHTLYLHHETFNQTKNNEILYGMRLTIHTHTRRIWPNTVRDSSQYSPREKQKEKHKMLIRITVHVR